jgi:hypothetical protein
MDSLRGISMFVQVAEPRSFMEAGPTSNQRKMSAWLLLLPP